MNEQENKGQEMEPELRGRLQAAVRGVTPPPRLEARIRAGIRETEERNAVRGWGRAWIAVAACGTVFAAGIVAYQLGHLRLTASSQNAYIASISNQVATIMRAGLKDHIHCTVFRKYSTPPTVEKLMADNGPDLAPLVQLVREKVPAGFQIMQAHECRYQGRKYVHVAARSQSRLLSLVITRKDDGESLAVENLVPAVQAAGIPVYRTGAQRFEIASFESRDHLVYVVSDLPRQSNLDVMVSLAPAVKSWLAKREA